MFLPNTIGTRFSQSHILSKYHKQHAWLHFTSVSLYTLFYCIYSWSICLCLCLTLGSVTCLALTAWLNTLPSFLFCCHLYPLLFDPSDRHARWVKTQSSFTCLCHLASLCVSISEPHGRAHYLHLIQWHLLVHFPLFILYAETIFMLLLPPHIFWQMLFRCPLCSNLNTDIKDNKPILS